jgi:hypothetical protein
LLETAEKMGSVFAMALGLSSVQIAGETHKVVSTERLIKEEAVGLVKARLIKLLSPCYTSFVSQLSDLQYIERFGMRVTQT